MAELRGRLATPRLLGVAILAAVMTASGVLLDRTEVDRTPEGEGASFRTGAWFCPHGGSAGWRGWIVLANPGDRAVRVRTTSITSTGAPEVTSFSVGPGRQLYREVPSAEPGAGTQVEYFGGWLGVAALTATSADPPAIAAQRCAGAPHAEWFLLDAPTARDQTAYVVVMNPFAAAAAVDVVLRTEERVVAPGTLTPLVVPAGRSIGIRLNDFVILGFGERTLAVQVVPKVGRVVVGGLDVSPGSVRSEIGLPSPQIAWSFAARGSEEWTVPSRSPGPVAAQLSFIAQNSAGQRLLPDMSDISFGPEGVRTFALDVETQEGALVRSVNGRPILATARIAGSGDDGVTINGAARSYRRWLVLPALPPTGGKASLVVSNPGLEPARIAVELLGQAGPVPSRELEALAVPPGATRAWQLPLDDQGFPVSALVRSSGASIVAGSSGSVGEDGYAATLGVPLTP